MSKGKVTPEQVAAALRESRGMCAVAGRKLGITAQAINGYCNRHKICQDARDEARTFTGDLAELKLLSAIEKGEAWATQLYLRTQGKERGYGDELTVKVEQASARKELERVMSRLSDTALAEVLAALEEEP